MTSSSAPISRLNSFTAFQQSQGDSEFPGTQLDADLDQLANALNDTKARVGTVVREDGKLGNGVVTRASLAADLAIGLRAARPWVAGTAYEQADTVTNGYGLYYANSAHTASSSFADDLAAERWQLQADLSQAVVINDGSVTGAKLAPDSVDASKIVPGGVGTSELAAGSVTRAKAAANLGVVPIGTESDYAGIVLPPGWLLCYGQSVSRSTYADLFNALSITFLADGTTGSPALANVTVPLAGIGLRGAAIEGPGVPAGTTLSVDVAGSVTLSQSLTAPATQGVFRLLPYGRGNGSTTFNLPDRRGRVAVGRDDMGGTAAGRLGGVMDATRLSSTGGAASQTLTNAQLPTALPGGQVEVSYPSQTFVLYDSLTSASTGAGGGVVQNLWQGTKNALTAPPANNTFGFQISNPGGGNPFATVQPSGVANRIIFAGA